MDSVLRSSNSRLGWWIVVLGLAAVLGYVVTEVLGAFVLGLFIYYVVRPLHRWLAERLSSDVAAAATFVGVIIPLIATVGYVVVVAVSELLSVFGGNNPTVSELLSPYLVSEELSRAEQNTLTTVLNNPLTVVQSNTDVANRALDVLLTVLGAAGQILFVLFIAGAIAYFLVQDDDRLVGWCRTHLFADGSAVDAFIDAVDHDLETVYLGNVFTVGLVAVAAAVVYNGYNFLAPSAVQMPIPTALALATGLASFVPIVVGKLVYVPLTGTLLLAAIRADGGGLLVYPVALFAVSLVFLDVLPQAILRPYLSGRELHTGATMLSYILGTTVFGWYGLFLGPLLLVLVVHAVRIVLPELMAGDRLTPRAADSSIGSDPDP